MADFKVNKQLTQEISELRSKGEAISDAYTALDSGEVNTLKTSMEIIAQHAQIKALLDLYKALVLRDAADMDAFVREANKMDEAISSSNLR